MLSAVGSLSRSKRVVRLASHRRQQVGMTTGVQLKQLPWAQVPVGHQHRDTGHGRRETRTVKASAVQIPGGIGFPHAQQAVRVTRTRMIAGKRTRETVYLVASLPAAHAQPADLPCSEGI
jgi:hypothetical protein